MKKLLLIPLLLIGCLSQPDVKPDNACGMFLHCMYYLQKAPDKTACIDFAKECRAKKRYEYCRKKENQEVSFANCVLQLNQK